MSPSLESLASLQLYVAIDYQYWSLCQTIMQANRDRDTNTALAATQIDLATALISDARRQVYALGLHTAQPKLGVSCVQLQICRRLFWEIYQSDKCVFARTVIEVVPAYEDDSADGVRTNVMNAISPISLHDAEGVPPLPLEVDDDYITASPAYTSASTSGPSISTSLDPKQPEGLVSYMTGFVSVSRIFQILGQCQIRQKTYANNTEAGPMRQELLHWVEDQRVGLREILSGLPSKLRADWREEGGFEKAEESSLGIQRANIHITALCVELALVSASSPSPIFPPLLPPSPANPSVPGRRATSFLLFRSCLRAIIHPHMRISSRLSAT